MRAILFILIVLVLVVLAGIASGFLDISQIRGAQAPAVSATGKGVQAKGGQTPAFDVQTGSVEIGTRNATVTVPELKVVPPASRANQADQNSVNAH